MFYLQMRLATQLAEPYCVPQTISFVLHDEENAENYIIIIIIHTHGRRSRIGDERTYIVPHLFDCGNEPPVFRSLIFDQQPKYVLIL